MPNVMYCEYYLRKENNMVAWRYKIYLLRLKTITLTGENFIHIKKDKTYLASLGTAVFSKDVMSST